MATDQLALGLDTLRRLERQLVERADEFALFLVYDRPERVSERPGLARTYFAQRCVSDAQLSLTIEAFRSVGAYVELFEGERPFIAALVGGRLQRLGRSLNVAYNGIGWGIAFDGFKPGRKALIPLVADSYGLICANSDAYACAFTLHKFHSFLVLDALGIRTPRTWHYRPAHGWVGGAPPDGAKVIAKSTYEAWSVGVTDGSVFVVDGTCTERVDAISKRIGQAVTVQEFVSGAEVCVPVLSCPHVLVSPPMQAVMARAPDDPDAIMTVDDNLRSGAVSHRRFRAPDDQIERISRSAVKVFDALQLQGLTRIDFRVDADGHPWVIDVAVSPGIGLKSSAYLSLAELGFDHPTFLRAVVAATLGNEGVLTSNA